HHHESGPQPRARGLRDHRGCARGSPRPGCAVGPRGAPRAPGRAAVPAPRCRGLPAGTPPTDLEFYRTDHACRGEDRAKTGGTHHPETDPTTRPGCVAAETTTDAREVAEHLASSAVDQGLAACVQISAIRSYYRW